MQLDLLDLLGEPVTDLAAVLAERHFHTHWQRVQLVRHYRGQLTRREVLGRVVGEMSGGTLDVDGRRGWCTARAAARHVLVHLDGQDHNVPWSAVFDRALAGLTEAGAVAIEAEQARLDAEQAAREERLAQLARYWPDGSEVRWVAPWDTSGGLRAGESVPGWRCWLCGDVEVNEHILGLNHGLTAFHAETFTRTTCAAQNLRHSQQLAAEAQERADAS